MTGIKLVNLNILIEEIGEEATKGYLSCFCVRKTKMLKCSYGKRR